MKHFAPSLAALLLASVQAFYVEQSAIAVPADVIGEHQTLQTVFTVYSKDKLEKLSIDIPARAFVSFDASVADEVSVNATAAANSTAPPANATAAPIAPRNVTAAPGVLTFTPQNATAAPAEAEVTFIPSNSTRAPAASALRSHTPTFAPVNATAAPVAPAVRSYAPVNATAAPASTAAKISSGSGSFAQEDIVLPIMSLSKSKKKHSEGDIVAKIVVTGNSTELLDLVQVVPIHPKQDDGLKIQLKNLANNATIRDIEAALTSALVVGDNVVVNNDKKADLKLTTAGSGNLLVRDSHDLSIGSLDVESAGAGNVSLEVSAVAVKDKLAVSVAGCGDVTVLANKSVSADVIKGSMSGAGDVSIQTANLTADTLDSSVFGAGSLSYSTNGTASKQKISVSGAGKVLTGSIVSDETEINMWGVGNAIVQAKKELKTTASFVGSVSYVGPRPADIKITGWYWGSADSYVKPAKENTLTTRAPMAVPARQALLVQVKLEKSKKEDTPKVVDLKVEGDAPAASDAVSFASVMDTSSSTSVLSVFVFVGAAMATVGLAARSFQQRRFRRDYTPLV
ncbi:TPA: hypothetical protein N0F65_002312 [Lagenidium giganteum]|uniref:Putative auto-transporter adhesin head GIN domain-containing protein n=1 Tax=Lagenidium giganteum TaxID=4803 RepID=A0AAV2Z3C7_9STRA|nr:TPA: hypothetical protein N0F65_002312 [Lagenidium giganteum]